MGINLYHLECVASLALMTLDSLPIYNRSLGANSFLPVAQLVFLAIHPVNLDDQLVDLPGLLVVVVALGIGALPVLLSRGALWLEVLLLLLNVAPCVLQRLSVFLRHELDLPFLVDVEVVCDAHLRELDHRLGVLIVLLFQAIWLRALAVSMIILAVSLIIISGVVIIYSWWVEIIHLAIQ